MAANVALSKNITFWHWYPELLIKDVTPEQLHWQPDGHDTSMMFAMWHAYRAADDLIHGMVMQRPSVFAAGGWSERLPIAETGATPFGNGLSSRANRAHPLRSEPRAGVRRSGRRQHQ